MRGTAPLACRALREDGFQRRLARAPHVERDDHAGRRDTVEDHRSDTVGMAAQVLLRHARTVAAAPQVPARVPQRFAHRFQVGDPRRRRVLRGVDALCLELVGARAGPRQRVEIERFVLAWLEGRAVQRRGAAGAALVDQHHVARAPHFGQAPGERRKRRGGLTRAAGENDERILLGRQRVRGEHGREDPDRATAGCGAVFRNLEFAALDGGREVGKPALGECDAARRVALFPQPARHRPTSAARKEVTKVRDIGADGSKPARRAGFGATECDRRGTNDGPARAAHAQAWDK